MLELYLGGARSGKSRLAEQRAMSGDKELVYVATATAGDDEMAQRIAHHQQSRGAGWITIEEPLALAEVLRLETSAGRCVLVDCLTLWLSNWLIREQHEEWQQARQELLKVLASAAGDIILVSNEVGQGVVPANRLARQFVDEAGWLHQDIASLSDRVVFVVAGLPQVIKGE